MSFFAWFLVDSFVAFGAVTAIRQATWKHSHFHQWLKQKHKQRLDAKINLYDTKVRGHIKTSKILSAKKEDYKPLSVAMPTYVSGSTVHATGTRVNISGIYLSVDEPKRRSNHPKRIYRTEQKNRYVSEDGEVFMTPEGFPETIPAQIISPEAKKYFETHMNAPLVNPKFIKTHKETDDVE